nr:immunoglobulin light chain junction region [Macaca mulatta]
CIQGLEFPMYSF